VLTAIAAASGSGSGCGTATASTTGPTASAPWSPTGGGLGSRWYLVAWDAGEQHWRTFLVDRMRPRLSTGPRFTPRKVPGGDVTAYVEKPVGRPTWRYRARILLHGRAAAPAHGLPPAVDVTARLTIRASPAA
jgi:WYL domain